MSSLRYRANGWDLRFRERNGRQRTERFAGGTPRRPPSSALQRKAEVEPQMYRGSYVAREERQTPFRPPLSALVGQPADQRDAAIHEVAHIARYRDDAARDDLVFTNARDGHILRFSWDALGPAVKRAGLDSRRVTWLTLRHTAASLMFDAGFTLFEVQHRLGHRSPTLTAKAYTHLMPERFEEGGGRLEAHMAAKHVRATEAGG